MVVTSDKLNILVQLSMSCLYSSYDIHLKMLHMLNIKLLLIFIAIFTLVQEKEDHE